VPPSKQHTRATERMEEGKHVQLEPTNRPSRAMSVATRVISANRRVNVTSTLVILVAMTMSVISGGIVIATRPTHVTGGRLVDSVGSSVGTAKLISFIDTKTLPARGADFEYSEIEYVKLDVTDPSTGSRVGKMGLRLLGYHWYNSTDMDLFLETGYTLHIAKHTLALAPTKRDEYGLTPPEDRRRKLWGVFRYMLESSSAQAQNMPVDRSSFPTAAELCAEDPTSFPDCEAQ